MKTDQIASSKPTVGGHVALDLMNTISLRNGERVDSFHSDQAVLDWLADYALDAGHLKFAPGTLLERARALRETVRTLVVARKEGRHLDPQLLNRWLTQGESHLELAQIAGQGLRLERRRAFATVEQLLAPVAEAAADLLTLKDFSVIRKCESPNCVLWFYDRTKGHKRRWCSMAGCGNRHKVSSFRKRQNE